MSKRVHIVLPDRTLKVLDRVAGKGGRSRYISDAVLFYVQTQAFSDLRRRLDEGISAGQLGMTPAAAFPVEKRATLSLDRKSQQAKTSRVVAKPSSRRSTWR